MGPTSAAITAEARACDFGGSYSWSSVSWWLPQITRSSMASQIGEALPQNSTNCANPLQLPEPFIGNG